MIIILGIMISFQIQRKIGPTSYYDIIKEVENVGMEISEELTIEIYEREQNFIKHVPAEMFGEIFSGVCVYCYWIKR